MTGSSISYLILNEIIFLFTRNVYKFPDDCTGKKGMQASRFVSSDEGELNAVV